MARVAVLWLGVGLLFLAAALYYRVRLWPALLLSGRRPGRSQVRRWNALIRFWGSSLAWLLRVVGGLRCSVEGSVPPGRHLVVANHQSTVDIVLLFHVLRPLNLKFVAKKSLARFVPNVSIALRTAGFGIVDPDRPATNVRNLLRFARSLEVWEGSPLLYPEGIRTFDGSLSRFQSAGLRLLARETGLPILPVVVDGLWHIRSIGRFFRGLPGTHARIRILPPIPNEEATADPDGFVERLEKRMAEELGRMRREGTLGVTP
jgi:1-acyl-sn-glycerol-3-phosphate acyltransferase